MQTWLVTGGAGFIGANFVRYALARGDVRVVVFDKLTYAGSLENLRDVVDDPRVTFLEADIADRSAVDAALSAHGPAAILNFAAETHVDRSIDGPRAFVRTNLVGTFELLDAARVHWQALDPAGRAGFRFLHVSTDEVYGSLGDAGAFSEETPYAPNSPYAASKAGADHLVRAYVHTYGLPALITNCSNNFGPYQFPEKLIPLVILNALDGRDLPIYGDGLNVRDWLYVEDHCDAVAFVLERGTAGEIYNIGGGREMMNIEITDLILRELGKPDSLKKYVADRPGHDRRYSLDISKIRRLGWSPRHTFEQAVTETIAWYVANEQWWRRIQSGEYRQYVEKMYGRRLAATQ